MIENTIHNQQFMHHQLHVWLTWYVSMFHTILGIYKDKGIYNNINLKRETNAYMANYDTIRGGYLKWRCHNVGHHGTLTWQLCPSLTMTTAWHHKMDKEKFAQHIACGDDISLHNTKIKIAKVWKQTQWKTNPLNPMLAHTKLEHITHL
jgi:hypothetical protein